jgi:hypothetical protein
MLITPAERKRPPRHFKREDDVLTGPLRPRLIYYRALTYIARNPWMRDGDQATLWEKHLPDHPDEVGRRIYLKRDNSYVGLYFQAGTYHLKRVHCVGMVEHKDGPMTVLQLSTFVAFLDWLYGVLPEVLRKTGSRVQQIKRAKQMTGLWVS